MGLFKRKNDEGEIEIVNVPVFSGDANGEPVVDYTPCPIPYAHPSHDWFESKVNGGVYQWATVVPDLPQQAKDNTVEYQCEGVEPKHAKES